MIEHFLERFGVLCELLRVFDVILLVKFPATVAKFLIFVLVL